MSERVLDRLLTVAVAAGLVGLAFQVAVLFIVELVMVWRFVL